ncbi:MAG: hypothetical protein F8N36_14360 [Desulfovibrio sp.]|uniref:hypothetical protein n=1 Tax=Desulfovibrio sp. TaxID=885 RepID=UPI00135EA0A0|nr:hypothetical protein [Desulfovibrio sp.]MTJ94021.1 hypothetical protein [Desulfovibrio sp.]
MTSDGYRQLGYLLRGAAIVTMIALARQIYMAITGNVGWPISFLASYLAEQDVRFSTGFAQWLIGVIGWLALAAFCALSLTAVLEACTNRAWPGRDRSFLSSGL